MAEKTSARSMAFDSAGVPYVLLRRGNEHLLARWGEGDRLEVVRKVSKGLWWFEIDSGEGDPVGLFQEDALVSAITTYDLRGDGKGRKLESAGDTKFFSWHRCVATCDGLYTVGAKSHLFRVEGAELIDLDTGPAARTPAEKSARFYLAGGKGLYTRRLGAGTAAKWQPFAGEQLERCKQLVYDRVRDRVVVVGTYRGRGKAHLLAADGTVQEHVSTSGQGYWSAGCLDGRVYLYADHEVVELREDGSVTGCGVRGEIARNQCLVTGPDALYFVCTDRIHWLRGGRWSVLDVAGQKLGAGNTKPSRPAPPPAPKRSPGKDVRALIERVTERFEDLDAFHVLADALQSVGDPRGELIALQCLDAPTASQRRRIEALIREHQSEWLGPLAEAASRGSVVFRRGFVREIGLKQKAASRSKELRGRPEWATVERLDVSMWPGAAAVDVLCDPVMRSLRVVDGLSTAASLTQVGNPAWHTLSLRDGLSVDDVATIRRATNLPALRHLTLEAQDIDQDLLEPVWTCALVRKLETLVVRCGQLAGVVPLWDKELRHLRRLRILPGGMDRGGGWELTLERERRTVRARFRFHWPNARAIRYGDLPKLMKALPLPPFLPLSATTIEVVQGATPPSAQESRAIASAAGRLGERLAWSSVDAGA